MPAQSTKMTFDIVDIISQKIGTLIISLRDDILRRQDELKALVQRSYDELCQDLRELTLKVELVEKAQEEQSAHPKMATL